MRTIVSSRINNSLPDQVYVPLLFYKVNKRFPNLHSPQRWSDKIQWLKLHGNLERFADYSDKYTVRSYVESTIGVEYLIPLLGVWDTFDDIPFDDLPNQFVLKVTHGCGYNFICKDKSAIDRTALKMKITGWQRENFYKQEREPQYKLCVPRIICEEYLEDPIVKELPDFKFYCSKGVPKAVQIDTERFVQHRSALLDLNWKPLEYVHSLAFDPPKPLPPRPKNLSEMLRIAGKLSKNFPYVRVDLYSVNNKIYFGELTFTPGSGLIKLQPRSGDIEFGKMIRLADYSERR